MTSVLNEPAKDGVTLSLLTNATPGAVAIIQLHGKRGGDSVTRMLTRLTGKTNWPLQRVTLADFGEIDHGLVFTWRDNWAQLMPHGGPRVVQKIVDHLMRLGALPESTDASGATDNTRVYPEAQNPLEADMLACMASAASPGAVDRLLAQPMLWRKACETLTAMRDEEAAALIDRSEMLDRLVQPPTVAVMGLPNVGKSTLTNVMLGRSASIVADMPGTTRDWVAGMTQLSGVSFRWLDTPGVRVSDDVIEQNAIGLAKGVIEQADVVIAMRDPHTPWPVQVAGSRGPDVWVMNKMDVINTAEPAEANAASESGDGSSSDSPLWISGRDNVGIERMGQAILAKMGQSEAHASDATTQLWAFNAKLQRIVRTRDEAGLKSYLGG